MAGTCRISELNDFDTKATDKIACWTVSNHVWIGIHIVHAVEIGCMSWQATSDDPIIFLRPRPRQLPQEPFLDDGTTQYVFQLGFYQDFYSSVLLGTVTSFQIRRKIPGKILKNYVACWNASVNRQCSFSRLPDIVLYIAQSQKTTKVRATTM